MKHVIVHTVSRPCGSGPIGVLLSVPANHVETLPMRNDLQMDSPPRLFAVQCGWASPRLAACAVLSDTRVAVGWHQNLHFSFQPLSRQRGSLSPWSADMNKWRPNLASLSALITYTVLADLRIVEDLHRDQLNAV